MKEPMTVEGERKALTQLGSLVILGILGAAAAAVEPYPIRAFDMVVHYIGIALLGFTVVVCVIIMKRATPAMVVLAGIVLAVAFYAMIRLFNF